MQNLTMDKEEFAKEIRVVMEERRLRTDDQPLSLLYEALYATAYASSPYKNPVVGWMDDLQNMTAADALAWYQRWYAPNNATMVVTGDVDAQHVRDLAEKYFGKIPPRTLPKTKPQREPAQAGIKRVVVKAPAENPYLMMAYKMPNLRDVDKDDDVHALDVLAAVLGRAGHDLIQHRHQHVEPFDGEACLAGEGPLQEALEDLDLRHAVDGKGALRVEVCELRVTGHGRSPARRDGHG